MSALKTLFVVAVLVGGLAGAYFYLNYNPESPTPPEIANEWPSSLAVSPGAPSGSAAAPQWNSDAPGTSAPAYGTPTPLPGSPAATASPAPAYAPAGSSAPPYAPMNAATPANASGPSEASRPGPGTTGAASPLLPPSGATGGTSSAPAWPAEGPSPVDPADVASLAQPAGFGSPTTNGPAMPNPAAAGNAPSSSYPAEPSAPPAEREDYATFAGRVTEALGANRLADAHLMLSQRYTDPNTSPDEARQLEPLLDQLAGTVIYSPQSMLEAPYEVLATDTLESIAQRYDVPPGLLMKINGLDPNATLQPGRQIKVVRGPFKAIVDTNRYELTLFLADNRYAGRFAIGVGPELRQEGELMVTDKQDLAAASGAYSQTESSRGTRWIGLGQDMGLHGTNQPESVGRPLGQGCISLGQRDIEDLYDILSIGSKVLIRR